MGVHLVGAGPGDPELITLKGRRVLEAADCVLYDELANPDLLAYAPQTAERIYVGKRAGHHAATQEQICAWIVERAHRGLNVVRLKGGDPLLFGRCGEEAEALARAGLQWEVVPGITAAQGAAASLGMPLTQRGVAEGVRYINGHAAIRARPGAETLAIYMGLARTPAICAELRGLGWGPATPAVMVERATLPGQRHVVGTLSDIAERVRAAALASPAVLLVGMAVGTMPAAVAGSDAVPQPDRTGIILMAHGSPLAAWHEDVERLARGLAAPTQFSRAAYLPPAEPSFQNAVAEAAAAGVRRLAVVPYFLAAGLHVERDLPELLQAERKRHPAMAIQMAACLGGHPALRTAVLARATEAFAKLGGG